jgi:hypothetical protein|tara:strand:+ start:2882 stop:3322 length:441 start_codon:yes stop_codon:yes gene_type:complete
MASLEQLQEAIETTEGKTPREILEAFIPKGKKVGGIPLVDITFGHGLFLSNINHPLATSSLDNWKPYDIAVALFAFTRSSKELTRLIREDELEDSLYEFLDGIPMDEVEQSSATLIAHYFGSMKTIVPMDAPEGVKAQKKTRSVGS